MIRLFVGLELDAASRRHVAQTANALRRSASGSFYDADLYHITLAFLGMLPQERFPALKNTLARVRFAPFSVKTGEVAAFEKGILYQSIQMPNDALTRLQADICAELRVDGWPFDDRPYVPHITLARKAKGFSGDACAQYADIPVRSFALFESARVDGRLCYTPIARWEARL